MTNTYTDHTTVAPILNFYSSEAQLTSQSNPSPSELHMVPLSLGARHVTEFYQSGSDGYRVWDDGFIEQWGKVSCTASGQSMTLLKPFTTTTYICSSGGMSSSYGNTCVRVSSTTSVTLWVSDDDSFNSGTIGYYICGY